MTFKNPLLPVFAAGLFVLAVSACKNTGGHPAADVIPAAAADTIVGYKGCDHCQFNPQGAHTFDFIYQNYTVRITERSDTAGIGMIVAPHRGGPHYNVPVPAGASYAGINRDFLFVDGKDNTGKTMVIIYDLPGQKELFRTNYADTLEILGNGKLWYWEPVKLEDIPEDKRPDCPEHIEWEAQGLFTVYAQRAMYNPETMVQVHKSEYQCFSSK